MAKKANPQTLKEPGYWQMKSVCDFIAERMSNYQDWLVPEGQQAWKVLREDVIRHNSKGRRTGTPRTGRVLMDDIEYDDGGGNYPRLRAGLFVFADLLIRFYKRMSKKYGKDYLDQVRAKFRSDPKAKAFLAMYETHIGSRSALVHALEQIGRKGLDFKTVGGIKGGYRDRDCGIAPLVELTHAIERHLRISSAKGREEQDIAVHQADRNKLHKAIVKLLESGRLEIHFQGKSINLSELQSQFVSTLFLLKTTVSYRELWKLLYAGEEYESDDSGPPSRLKTLKKTVKDKLTKFLGSLPHDAEWITTEENVGYSLNRIAVNWVNEKNFVNIREKVIKARSFKDAAR